MIKKKKGSREVDTCIYKKVATIACIFLQATTKTKDVIQQAPRDNSGLSQR